jgi:hypothetical protein
MAAGFTFIPDDDFEMPKGLSTRDQKLARSLYQTPAERAAIAAQERELYSSNVKQLDEAIAAATDPAVRKVLVEERAKLLKPAAPAKKSFTFVEEAPAAPAVEGQMPAPRTLEDRQAERTALEQRADRIQELIQQLEEQGQDEAVIAPLRQELRNLRVQAKRTGVGSTGRNIGATVGGVLGALGGGALGSLAGPVGTVGGGIAGSAAGVAAGTALGTKLDLALAEPVTADEASQLLRDRVVEDVAWDVAGNALFLVGGKVLKVALNPEIRHRLMTEVADLARGKVGAKLKRAADEATEALFDATRTTTGRQALESATDAQARAAGVPQLLEKSAGALPTTGQLTGKAGLGERASRSLHPKVFEEAEEKLQAGAREMREELIRPAGQPSRQELGQKILGYADEVEKAVKARTGQVFQDARSQGVAVDFTPVDREVRRILAQDEATPGGMLKAGERAHLQRIIADLERTNPNANVSQPGANQLFTTNAGAVEFVSGNKARMREMTAEGAPSEPFKKLLAEINNIADTEYQRSLGKPNVPATMRRDLLKARDDYRNMMETKFGSDVAGALRKNPEDVGRHFWQAGNVTEVQQLNDLLNIAVKEGRATADDAAQLMNEATRGFLAEAVPDIASAAKWSETLAKDPKKRDTFRALVARPGMQDLDRDMKILEEAAKVAMRRNADLSLTAGGYLGNIPQRAGVGLAMGFLRLGTAVTLFSADVLAKVISTAATNADKGMLRNARMVMRAIQAGDDKFTNPAVREAAIRVAEYARQNGIAAPTAEETE